jgi:alkylation response protein AidB-like acyl-CoA dehydrogenase
VKSDQGAVVLLRFLAQERSTLEHFLPGLDAKLAAMPLAQLESPRTQAIAAFREFGGVGLLIPDAQRGRGAGPVDAVRIQRALGSRSPSLAVATTMHHFSTATMLELWRIQQGIGWMLLQAIGEGKLLLASGFAEGVRGQGVLTPTMCARRVNGGVVISGTKKPCSLSRSMDLLTASVIVTSDSGAEPGELAIALVPANAPGVEVKPFWGTPVLAGAESDAVTLTDVKIESDLVIGLGDIGSEELDNVEVAGFLWFTLLITASYLGIASALVERMLEGGRGEAMSQISAAMELEATMASLECVALRLAGEGASADLLLTTLLCRFSSQDAINRAVACSVEQLGGMAFVRAEDVGYFASASRALAFHPPARTKNAQLLVNALGGQELVIT